jgi:putative membrane protein
MWLERVPVVIPLSWFFMALPSYALAARVSDSPAVRVGAASLVLLAWDLALDPAMSFVTRYWSWGDAGPYYGMPWLNLFGWYVTGLVLMGVLAVFRAERWTARIGQRWWLAYYGANLALPLGMCAAAGLWPAVAATLGVLVLLGDHGALGQRSERRVSPAREPVVWIA